MRVLLLSPYQEILVEPMKKAIQETDVLYLNDETAIPSADIVVLWGWRRILMADELKGHAVMNIHQSVLPWNRGACPNLFSWYEDTLKGVTIHQAVEAVDAGPCFSQVSILLDEQTETLRTSYDKLQDMAVKLFCSEWPALRRGSRKSWPQPLGGSKHFKWEGADLLKHFPKGMDTPVREVAELGRAHRRQAI